MSIKTNEFGEVISVNGITTGHHIGKPMQDAVPDRPEDNENYATELAVVTRNSNVNEDEQPMPTGGSGSGSHYVIIDIDGKIKTSDGIYDALKNYIYNLDYVSVDVGWRRTLNGTEDYIGLFAIERIEYGSDDIISLYCEQGMNIYLHPDGSCTYYYD